VILRDHQAPRPELLVDLLAQFGDKAKSRHFVFILVGHQLVEVARNRFGKLGRSWHVGGLGCPHALDKLCVPFSVLSVLVGHEYLVFW
jgi:hypothetical protein